MLSDFHVPSSGFQSLPEQSFLCLDWLLEENKTTNKNKIDTWKINRVQLINTQPQNTNSEEQKPECLNNKCFSSLICNEILMMGIEMSDV